MSTRSAALADLLRSACWAEAAPCGYPGCTSSSCMGFVLEAHIGGVILCPDHSTEQIALEALRGATPCVS